MPKLEAEPASVPKSEINPDVALVLSIIFGDVAVVVLVPVSAKTGVTVPLLEDKVYVPLPFGVIVIVTFAPLSLNVFVSALADGANARPVKLRTAVAESSVKPKRFEALSFPATTEFPKILNCAAERLPAAADNCNFLFESK